MDRPRAALSPGVMTRNVADRRTAVPRLCVTVADNATVTYFEQESFVVSQQAATSPTLAAVCCRAERPLSLAPVVREVLADQRAGAVALLWNQTDPTPRYIRRRRKTRVLCVAGHNYTAGIYVEPRVRPLIVAHADYRNYVGISTTYMHVDL